MREKYEGSIEVEFDGMPAIELETLIAPDNASGLERISVATTPRKFSLREDWELDLTDIDYVDELNGTIIIPKNNTESEPNIFDGASVPVPWLISLLTIGVLRPLGIMLIASIVHDFAYSHGFLWVKENGKRKKVELERHHADKLFRDIISTINGLPLVGYIAWLAVRIGWIYVPYNNTARTGRIPYSEYLLVLAILILLFFISVKLGAYTLYVFLGFYLVFFGISILLQKVYK